MSIAKDIGPSQKANQTKTTVNWPSSNNGNSRSWMTVKSAWIIAGLICGIAATATVVISGSILAAVPFFVLFVAAGTVASIISSSPNK